MGEVRRKGVIPQIRAGLVVQRRHNLEMRTRQHPQEPQPLRGARGLAHRLTQDHRHPVQTPTMGLVQVQPTTARPEGRVAPTSPQVQLTHPTTQGPSLVASSEQWRSSCSHCSRSFCTDGGTSAWRWKGRLGIWAHSAQRLPTRISSSRSSIPQSRPRRHPI